MQRRLTLFSLALGAVMIVAPSLGNIGTDIAYDTALAAKGGNGKGNGGGNGNTRGNSQSAKGKGTSSATGGTTDVASVSAKGKQKTSAKQLALTDPLAPAHPSMLGRWNAAKPLDHPAIQAHIRNGKFNGTIGMVAAYAVAQTNYNSYQSNLAAAAVADPAVAALATALTAAGYATVSEYNAAVTSGAAAPVAAIETAIATTDITTGLTTTLTPEQIAAADTLATQGATAFSDLSSAEANMEAWSNRSEWSVIRDDVRSKMDLDPMENDLVVTTPTEPVTTTP
jgi:hypothetical protein